MSVLQNPAMSRFLAEMGDERVFVQVCIRRVPQGYRLLHVADREIPLEQLRLTPVEQLRAVAEATSSGAFRPLKSAPNLRAGWYTEARVEAELEQALNHLYPGGVADWVSAQSTPAPVTNF